MLKDPIRTTEHTGFFLLTHLTSSQQLFLMYLPGVRCFRFNKVLMRQKKSEAHSHFFSPLLLLSLLPSAFCSLSNSLIDVLNLYFHHPAAFISPGQIVSLSSLSSFASVLSLSSSAVLLSIKDVLLQDGEGWRVGPDEKMNKGSKEKRQRCQVSGVCVCVHGERNVCVWCVDGDADRILPAGTWSALQPRLQLSVPERCDPSEEVKVQSAQPEAQNLSESDETVDLYAELTQYYCCLEYPGRLQE